MHPGGCSIKNGRSAFSQGDFPPSWKPSPSPQSVSFGLSALWKLKTFPSHKTLFGYTQILFWFTDRVLGNVPHHYKNVCLRDLGSASWKCVCNHGREACVYMCVCKSWERSTALQTWNWCFLWLSLVLQFDQNYREKLTNFALIDWFCKRCKLFRAHTAFSNVFSRNHIISTPLNFRARSVLFNLCLVSSRLILIWKSFQK